MDVVHAVHYMAKTLNFCDSDYFQIKSIYLTTQMKTQYVNKQLVICV